MIVFLPNSYMMLALSTIGMKNYWKWNGKWP